MQSSSPGPVGTGKKEKWHLGGFGDSASVATGTHVMGHLLGFVLLMNKVLVVPRGPTHVLGSQPNNSASIPKNPAGTQCLSLCRAKSCLPGLGEEEHIKIPSGPSATTPRRGLDFPRVEKKMLNWAKEELERESAPERSWESRGPRSDACVLWLDSKAQ